MQKSTKLKQMNKKGLFLEFGAVLLIIISTVGLVASITNANEVYVGDSSTHEFVNYYKCKEIAKTIHESHLVIFHSKTDALISGYNVTKGCV